MINYKIERIMWDYVLETRDDENIGKIQISEQGLQFGPRRTLVHFITECFEGQPLESEGKKEYFKIGKKEVSQEDYEKELKKFSLGSGVIKIEGNVTKATAGPVPCEWHTSGEIVWQHCPLPLYKK